MNIKITAESTCDLSAALLRAHDIALLPLYVNLGDRCLRDVVEVAPGDIFSYVESGKGVCTTSAGSIGDYLDLFGTYAGSCDAVIHVALSSRLSSCYQNAVLAAEEFGNVYVVDSGNLSVGQGLVVLRAAALAELGMAPEAIVEALECYREKVDSSFVLEQLEYLHRGGRCSGVVALGANLLKLKPCIEVKQGSMDVGKKYRGSLAKCLEAYIRDRLTDVERVDCERLFIAYAGVDEEILQLACRTVADCGFTGQVTVAEAGCTISSHCGPGTLGVLFARK